MGKAYYSQNKYYKTIESFEKAISLKPDFADAYHNLGVTHHKHGKLDKAIWAFKKVSIEPDNAYTYNKIIGAFYRKGHLELSIKYLKKSLFF